MQVEFGLLFRAVNGKLERLYKGGAVWNRLLSYLDTKRKTTWVNLNHDNRLQCRSIYNSGQ